MTLTHSIMSITNNLSGRHWSCLVGPHSSHSLRPILNLEPLLAGEALCQYIDYSKGFCRWKIHLYQVFYQYFIQSTFPADQFSFLWTMQCAVSNSTRNRSKGGHFSSFAFQPSVISLALLCVKSSWCGRCWVTASSWWTLAFCTPLFLYFKWREERSYSSLESSAWCFFTVACIFISAFPTIESCRCYNKVSGGFLLPLSFLA